MEKLLHFTVNGKPYKIHNANPQESLADWLRKQPGLSGTKVMCREGGCGCCMVNIIKDGETVAVNSCLKPICSLQGAEVITIEGLGSSREGFHPIQKRVADFNGSQCGYCTPGFVMSMHGLLSNDKSPDEGTIESTLYGNICRCTGYRPILDAMKSFANDGNCKDIEDITLCKGDCTQKCKKQTRLTCDVDGSISTWFYPQTLTELQDCFKRSEHNLKIRCGFTGGSPRWWSNNNNIVDISNVKELHLIERGNDCLEVGAVVSLNKLYKLLVQHKDESTTFQPMAEHLTNVATTSVRNVASWAGNLMVKYRYNPFPSDILTIFIAAGAKLVVMNLNNGSQETIELSGTSFLKYDMNEKIILKVIFPKFKNSTETRMKTFKVAPRSKNALAMVNAAFRATVKDNLISDCVLAFGGINDTFTNAASTETYLKGKPRTQDTLTAALECLNDELNPVQSNAANASAKYKLKVALGCFYKFFLSLLDPSQLPVTLRSAVTSFERGVSSARQVFDEDETVYPVNKALPKISGAIQASGEAYYSSDKVPTQDELFAVFVKSQRANADMESIDVSQAVKMPGCHKIIYGDNFPSSVKNSYHPDFPVHPIIATNHVDFAGQPVAMVIADSAENAKRIACKVKVTYKNMKKPILTIDDAVEHQSFYPSCPDINRGDVKTAMDKADVTFSGEMSTGSQYHNYMELQFARCTPTDDGGLDVECGTQSQKGVQHSVANALGIACNKINVSTKRVGGAFGGKAPNARIVACAAALGAIVTRRPVRLCTDMQDCMETYGMRSRYKIKYTVGVNRDGLVQAVEYKLYSDCGSGEFDAELTDAGIPLGFLDNAYFCPNRSVEMFSCKTNIPPITWFRCPGVLQINGFANIIMDHAASELNMDPTRLMKINLYKDGQITFAGDKLQYCMIDKVVSELTSKYNLEERKIAIEKFNAENKWKKKGLAMAPVKYCVFTNWATFTAQVAIYATDGTVCISHGGIECGQGINTKVSQVAALALGIDMSLISVQTTQSLTSPNSTDTGAAITSEVCSMAVWECCKILNTRIDPIRKKLKTASWEVVISKCMEENVDLLATFQSAPRPDGFCTYHVYAAAMAEVDLDVLTGQYQVTQADIVYDCGKSLNPIIDIGQIEGAFVMAMGFWMSEKIVYDEETGKLLTNDTWNYHVPGAADIPLKWNIELLKEAPYPSVFMRSKTAGEPPMCTSVCTFLALKHAIASYMKECGNDRYADLDAPATVEDVYAKLAVYPIQDFHI